jgi:hypothetical protein
MKRTEFLDKVANDTRAYVQSLIDENQRLGKKVAELEIERDQRLTREAMLQERLDQIESEGRKFAERYVEVEQQNTNLANLYVASYQLNGTLDRERVIGAVQEIVINLIGSEEMAIWEVEEELNTLSLIGSFGIDADEWSAVPIGSGMIGKVAETGSRFVVDEALFAPEEREEKLTACIPLKLDDKVVGVIGIFQLLQQKPGLEAVDYELFDLLGSHAASALFCTNLYSRYVEQVQ